MLYGKIWFEAPLSGQKTRSRRPLIVPQANWRGGGPVDIEGEEGGDEVYGGVAGVGLVVARGDTSELLDPLEEVLNQVTPPVHLDVVRDGRFAVRLRRDDSDGAPVDVRQEERLRRRLKADRLLGFQAAFPARECVPHLSFNALITCS